MSDPTGSIRAGGGLSGGEAAALTGRIADLTRAGLPLAPGLIAMGEELDRGRLRRAMEDLARALDAGVPLDEAIESRKGGIPPHLRGLVIAGTRSGQLGDILGRFSGYVSIGAELKRRLWLSLAYPILSVFIALSLFAVTSVYLVGQFEAIFKDFGVPLPGVTIAVLNISHVVSALWSTLLFLAAALLVFWFLSPLLMRPPQIRSLASRVPLVGAVWKWTSLSEFSHLLALLLESRLSLPESLRLAGEGVQDADIAASSRRLAASVESGQPLSEAAAVVNLFPPGLARLLRWAETQRSLPEVLHMIADMFEARARGHATFTGTVLGTLSVFLVLFGVFTIIGALMLPLITLISRLSG